jgi:hypothetical protein
MSDNTPRRRHYELDPRCHVVLWQCDLRILEAIYRNRFLSTHHVLALVAGSRQRLKKRLRELTDAGYLIRIRNPAPRMQNQGSRAILYGISNLAADALDAAGLVPRDRVNWTRRNVEVADPRTGLGIKIVPHTIGMSGIMVAVECCVRRSNGALRLITEQEILATLAPERTRRSRYPFTWHVEVRYPCLFHDDQGEEQVRIEPRRIGVAPDKIFGIEMRHLPEGRNRLFFFVEYDRNTSAVTLEDAVDYAQFEKSSLYKKLLAYAGTWVQGVHTSRFGLKSFQTLFITESDARTRTLVEAFTLLKSKVLPVWGGDNLDMLHRIFRFAGRSSGVPDRLLRYVWVNGHGAPAPLSSIPEDL